MLTQEELEKLHKVEIKPLPPTDRHAYIVVCSCGVQARVFSFEEADKFRVFHLNRKVVAPY